MKWLLPVGNMFHIALRTLHLPREDHNSHGQQSACHLWHRCPGWSSAPDMTCSGQTCASACCVTQDRAAWDLLPAPPKQTKHHTEHYDICQTLIPIDYLTLTKYLVVSKSFVQIFRKHFSETCPKYLSNIWKNEHTCTCMWGDNQMFGILNFCLKIFKIPIFDKYICKCSQTFVKYLFSNVC